MYTVILLGISIKNADDVPDEAQSNLPLLLTDFPLQKPTSTSFTIT
jgi:hypothetical protein